MRSILMSMTAAVVALGLAACGGSGSSDTVAQVGGSSITRATVSSWMSTLGGGDYYELSGQQTLPAGLVSDPPNYARCVSTLETAIAASAQRGFKLPVALTPADLLRKCRELNQALRTQATTYLVQAQWEASVDRDEGIIASDQEVQQLFKKVKAEQYPTAADLRHYLASTRSNLADFLFILRLDVLQQKTTRRLGAEGQRVLAAFTEAGKRWTAKTTCSTGYVVEHCKQFRGGPIYADTLSPAILMEQVAALVTGRCVNQAACGKE
jgi:hypothetical protein